MFSDSSVPICFVDLTAAITSIYMPPLPEALETGATTLLVDEDTCATNFMIRDQSMQELVAANKEPITAFIRKVPCFAHGEMESTSDYKHHNVGKILEGSRYNLKASERWKCCTCIVRCFGR